MFLPILLRGLAYLTVGAGCAALRLYLDPWLNAWCRSIERYGRAYEHTDGRNAIAGLLLICWPVFLPSYMLFCVVDFLLVTASRRGRTAFLAAERRAYAREEQARVAERALAEVETSLQQEFKQLQQTVEARHLRPAEKDLWQQLHAVYTVRPDGKKVYNEGHP